MYHERAESHMTETAFELLATVSIVNNNNNNNNKGADRAELVAAAPCRQKGTALGESEAGWAS